MQTPHFFIWCGISILFIGSCVIAWCVYELRSGQSLANKKAEDSLNRIVSMERWAKSWLEFQEHLSKAQSTRCDDLNSRLIQLETENKNIPPVKREDEDPFTGSRSWAAQVAAAERGEGVRI
jgi:hypothetical protein